jgi:hypothetical protein
MVRRSIQTVGATLIGFAVLGVLQESPENLGLKGIVFIAGCLLFTIAAAFP